MKNEKEYIKYIEKYGDEGAKLRENFFVTNAEKIRKAAYITAVALAKGGKLLICGNGGSAADAQHIAGEFINKFLIERPSLPAIALTTDSSVLTAIGNDLDYSQIFSRQLEGLAKKGDILLAISTSGSSPNIIRALEAAREKEIYSIGLSGGTGGKMTPICNLLITVNSKKTPLIQEVHLACEHILCELVEDYLFKNVGEIREELLKEEK